LPERLLAESAACSWFTSGFLPAYLLLQTAQKGEFSDHIVAWYVSGQLCNAVLLWIEKLWIEKGGTTPCPRASQARERAQKVTRCNTKAVIGVSRASELFAADCGDRKWHQPGIQINSGGHRKEPLTHLKPAI
jgi:hypothetical protein